MKINHANELPVISASFNQLPLPLPLTLMLLFRYCTLKLVLATFPDNDDWTGIWTGITLLFRISPWVFTNVRRIYSGALIVFLWLIIFVLLDCDVFDAFSGFRNRHHFHRFLRDDLFHILNLFLHCHVLSFDHLARYFLHDSSLLVLGHFPGPRDSFHSVPILILYHFPLVRLVINSALPCDFLTDLNSSANYIADVLRGMPGHIIVTVHKIWLDWVLHLSWIRFGFI